jgi:hypothetical protein
MTDWFHVPTKFRRQHEDNAPKNQTRRVDSGLVTAVPEIRHVPILWVEVSVDIHKITTKPVKQLQLARRSSTLVITVYLQYKK